ncbi:MAG: DUF1659 domain-containing protein [Synergistaceae bacterium]|jgi:hypothetical protein|nr:DUF1659 domain-containing protein [Synergistaceae bacterium]
MARLELVGCRIAIQMNVGHLPNGRARRRTIVLRNVRPDASADQLAAVVLALEKVIAHPIIRVRVVKKYILVTDGEEARRAAPSASLKLPACGGGAHLKPCPYCGAPYALVISISFNRRLKEIVAKGVRGTSPPAGVGGTHALEPAVLRLQVIFGSTINSPRAKRR